MSAVNVYQSEVSDRCEIASTGAPRELRISPDQRTPPVPAIHGLQLVAVQTLSDGQT